MSKTDTVKLEQETTKIETVKTIAKAAALIAIPVAVSIATGIVIEKAKKS